MIELERLYQAVLDRPEDASAHLAYASALDAQHDPLGEFIRLHLDNPAIPTADSARLPIADRLFNLCVFHQEAWAGRLKQLGVAYAFRGGLIEDVTLDADVFLEHPGLLLSYPIRGLTLTHSAGKMEAVAASPVLARIERLTLRPGHLSWRESAPSLELEDIKTLAAQAQLGKIRALDICGNESLGPDAVQVLLDASWIGRIQELDLSWTAIGDEGGRLLSTSRNLTKLRSLNLSNCGLTLHGAKALAQSRTLAESRVDIDYSLNDKLGRAGQLLLLQSPVVAGMIRLQFETEVDGELIERLEQSPCLGSLKDLGFYEYKDIHESAMERLAQWPGLRRLQSLTFIISKFSDSHLSSLSKSPHLSTLREFMLSETCVQDAGIAEMARSGAWSGLRSLQLDRNSLSRQAVRDLLSAPWFPRLQVLDLHATYHIGDEGAELLAAHTAPCDLRRLGLTMAGIGDVGARAFSRSTLAREQLHELGLRGNPEITTSAREEIQTALGPRVSIEPHPVMRPGRPS